MRYLLTLNAIAAAAMLPVVARMGAAYMDVGYGLHPMVAGAALVVLLACSVVSINLIVKE